MRLPLVLATGVLLLTGCGGSGEDGAGSPAPSRQTRLVGLGHAAVEVPDSWGTNESTCGTPMVDTVIVGVAVTPDCKVDRPRMVESVEVMPGRPETFDPDRAMTLDGVRAERQRTTCTGRLAGGGLCTGAIHIPSEEVTFRAESSTGGDEVDEVLQGVQLVPDRVGVPAFETIDVELQKGARTRYAAAVREAGLVPRIVEERAEEGLPVGYVLGSSPAPGTMVEPGTEVTVRVAAP